MTREWEDAVRWGSLADLTRLADAGADVNALDSHFTQRDLRVGPLRMKSVSGRRWNRAYHEDQGARRSPRTARVVTKTRSHEDHDEHSRIFSWFFVVVVPS
jgi:hypothetical protein